MIFYTGTWKGEGEGIYAVELCRGKLHRVGYTAQASPTYMISRGDLLYAVAESKTFITKGGTQTCGGGLISYRINADRSLTPIDSTPTIGCGPCHLALSEDGGLLVSANYASGTVSAVRVDPEGHFISDTKLYAHTALHKRNQDRQSAAHCHYCYFMHNCMYVVDLGMDAVVKYNICEDGFPCDGKAFTLPEGCGPRHFVVKDGYLYCACELGNTIQVMHIDGNELQWVGETGVFGENTPLYLDKSYPAAIKLTPDGQYLCVSNRGDESVSIFTAEPNPKPVTKLPTGGSWPRDIAILPGEGKGEYLLLSANQYAGSLTLTEFDLNGKYQLLDSIKIPGACGICIPKF